MKDLEFKLHHRLPKFDWSVFLNLKPISCFLGFYMAWFFYLKSIGVRWIMIWCWCIWEKAISILVGYLNSSSSYLITAVTRYLILATENQSFEVYYRNRDSSNIQPCQTYCIILWTTCVQGWGFVILKLLDYQ